MAVEAVEFTDVAALALTLISPLTRHASLEASVGAARVVVVDPDWAEADGDVSIYRLPRFSDIADGMEGVLTGPASDV